jgi:hypothetical protein
MNLDFNSLYASALLPSEVVYNSTKFRSLPITISKRKEKGQFLASLVTSRAVKHVPLQFMESS